MRAWLDGTHNASSGGPRAAARPDLRRVV